MGRTPSNRVKRAKDGGGLGVTNPVPWGIPHPQSVLPLDAVSGALHRSSAPQGFPSFLRGWCVQAGRPQSTEGDPVSIRVVAWVLEMSEARLGARLVLLALASHAR